MRSSHPKLLLLLCTTLGACGGDAGSSTTCQLSAQLSGAIQWQADADPACLVPFGSSSGISMMFKPISGDVATFDAEVASVTAGQTGSFPAKIEIDLRDGRKWATSATGCTVSIDEDTFVSQDQFQKRYQIAGHGQCQGAAMPLGGASGTITIAPFTYRFPASF